MTVHLNKLKPLIDMDLMVYRCGFAADAEVKNAGYDLEDTDYLRNALGNVNVTMDSILSKFNDEYRGFISGDGNFREQVATIKPYKGNRDSKHKPKYYKEIKQHLVDRWNAEVVHGREADDALATAQWAAKDLSTILVTIDKDLDMVPGHHFNWVKKEFYFVPLKYANLRLFWQMLEGDVSDNIPGINGLGKVRIQKLFDELDNNLEAIRDMVQEKYRDQYGENWRAAYEEVAKLLWMERVEGKECPFLY
jgi:5'-3' exonuclease